MSKRTIVANPIRIKVFINNLIANSTMKINTLCRIKRRSGMILCWIFLMWCQLPISGAEPVRDEVLLEDAFHQIGIQYGVYFSYDRTLVSSVKVNSESDQSRKIEDALAYVSTQT